MASLKFLLQSKTAPANIYVRLSLGHGAGKDFKRKTGYFIDPKDWDKDEQTAHRQKINSDAVFRNLDAHLSDLKSKLKYALNDAVKAQSQINGDWLQAQINDIHGKSPIDERDCLSMHIQWIIDNASRIKKPNGQLGLSNNRIKGYATFKNTILRFEKEANNCKSILIREVDSKLADKFTEWLFQKGYSINYIGKNIDNLKAVCNHAGSQDIEISPQLKYVSGFTEKKKSEDVIILSEEEQEKIANTHLEREALINARRWLLLGCQIGQRFGDLIKITPDEIRSSNGIKILEIEQQKTGRLVAIPLLPKALDIIENEMPYPISIQNFNDYIKEVCKAAGINKPTSGAKYIDTGKKDKNKPKIFGTYPKHELIGSHICRRSFASNFYGKIPTPILINITGHGSEKMFLKYIGRTAYDNAHQMMEYFGNLQAKAKKEPQLQILKNVSNQ